MAVWREGLLREQFLKGETRGYKKPSPTPSFQKTGKSLLYLDNFLNNIYHEAESRDIISTKKIGPVPIKEQITVTQGSYNTET